MDACCFSERWGKEAHDGLLEKQRCVWVNGPIIVGAGPSGLATAACLREQGVSCVILEKADCLVSLWQQRTYNRLKLHLPKQFCELPLMPFPDRFPTYPTKEQFIEYIESYAKEFKLQPRFNQRVESASYDRTCGHWRVRTVNTAACDNMNKNTDYISRWLVVASGENAEPIVPDIAGVKSFRGSVIHASRYRTGADYEGKKVLVVGCGNSGMELCLDLFNHNAKPFMVVRNTVHVLPREMFGRSTFGVAMALMKRLPLWMVDRFLLAVAYFKFGNTECYGLKRPALGPMELKDKTGKTPVLDVGTLAQIKNGNIKVLPAISCLTPCGAKFLDGQKLEFDSVILCTGYRSNVPNWLKDSDFFSDDGMPKTPFPDGWKGENGLYSVGFTRRGLLGASLDARRIAQDIGGLLRAGRKQQFVLA
eukprot:PITA_00622